MPSRSETSCRYNCLLDSLSLAACKASLELNGVVSSIIENVESSINTRSGLADESSINTRSGLADDVVTSRGNVERGESEALKLGISAYEAEKGMVSFLTHDLKQLSTDS